MTVYYIISYDIDNMEAFKEYGPAVFPLFQKYGAQVLASDTTAIAIEGHPKMMNAVVKFPSQEAALACYNDPEYVQIKRIRIDSTSNCTIVLAKQFEF